MDKVFQFSGSLYYVEIQSWQLNNNFADMRLRLQVLVGIRCLFEGEHLVDNRAKVVCCDQPIHVLESESTKTRAN